MHERQPNPEDMTPDLPHSVSPEQPLVSPESLTKTELAEQIIAEYGSHHVDSISGAVALRDSWANRSQMHSFHLLAFTVNGAPRYLLDVRHVGVDGERRYAFGEDQTIIYYYPNSNVECPIPEQSVLHESLMGYLRKRYMDTQHYIDMEQRFENAFDDATTRFSAEYALDFTAEFESGERQAAKLYVSDPVTRKEARNRLYQIARLAGVVCEESSFQLALDQTLQERNTRRQTPTNNPGMAKIADTMTFRQPKPWYRFLGDNQEA